MIKRYFFAALAACATIGLSAQTRYVDEVFSSVDVTQNVLYGQNVTVLPALQGQPPALQPLIADVYEPTGDTLSARPLMLFVHTGNFLPRIINGSLVGTLRDSTVTEICTRLAKRGYVVASIDYRTGWNPLASTQTERTKLLLQAVYRAVQDGRTAVRYFRFDADNGNTFSIDPNRIGVMGEGSGGYVALAMATLNRLDEVQLDKFIDFTDPQNPVPFVDTNILGNFEGLGNGAPIDTLGNTFNNPNHPGYSSEISFCVNMGGALGDSSWLEGGEVPMVSFHCQSDPFAPYEIGTVVVPTTQANVVEVIGSKRVIERANDFGNQPDEWFSINDDYTTRAFQLHGNGYEGLYTFVTASPEAGPWQWWNPAEDTTANMDLHNSGLLTNPGMSKAKAMLYLDTVFGYLSPRLAESFATADIEPTSVETLQANEGVSVYPNPVSNVMMVASKQNIESVKLFDLTGALVETINATSSIVEIKRADKPAGIYFVEVQTATSKQIVKVLFN